MINRHQGMVDKVQPRIRSMFEPEAAPAVAMANPFVSTTDKMVKESRNTGLEPQLAYSKSPIIEESNPETSRSAILQQAVQSDEGSRASDLHLLDGNRMDLMNEQIQSVLARLGRKSEIQEPINDANKTPQNQASSDATDQTKSNAVANEQGLANGIEETIRRLKNQTNNAKEGQRGFEGYVQTLPTNTVKTEVDPLVTLPAHPEITGEQSADPQNKATNYQVQTANTPINSQGGSLQIPAWLTGMQTDLNSRWREINAQSQAEPVINVTIGRVEIRATNPESAKPGRADKKPTGVMSLDDYLKQRENKGRT
ncbi:MAG: hypothetical protein WC685_03840 [Methylobacter sp.]